MEEDWATHKPGDRVRLKLLKYGRNRGTVIRVHFPYPFPTRDDVYTVLVDGDTAYSHLYAWGLEADSAEDQGPES